MRKEYDFSKLKAASPQYLKILREPVTMRLDVGVINYFKKIAEETGMPYQSLINYILREYANHEMKPTANWEHFGKKSSKSKVG